MACYIIFGGYVFTHFFDHAFVFCRFLTCRTLYFFFSRIKVQYFQPNLIQVERNSKHQWGFGTEDLAVEMQRRIGRNTPLAFLSKLNLLFKKIEQSITNKEVWQVWQYFCDKPTATLKWFMIAFSHTRSQYSKEVHLWIKNASCHARQQQKICYFACLWCLKHETYANRLAITISKQDLRISWCHESKN